MTRKTNARSHRAGVSMTHALLVVVGLGVAATMAIPRLAKRDARDELALTELQRATVAVARYHLRSGRYPTSPAEAGFTPAAGVDVVMWKVQPVAGTMSVHLHFRHRQSHHQFHAHYPAEDGIRPLPWEW